MPFTDQHSSRVIKTTDTDIETARFLLKNRAYTNDVIDYIMGSINWDIIGST